MTDTPSSLVDSVFARLVAVYGLRFTSHWPDAHVPEVKRQWMRELREFDGNPEAIDYALEHLPSGNPPMVLDLRDIARMHRTVTVATNERRQAPVTEAERERALAILSTFRRPSQEDPKAWARRLRLRELSGERLTLFQRACWREVVSPSHTEATFTHGEPGEKV